MIKVLQCHIYNHTHIKSGSGCMASLEVSPTPCSQQGHLEPVAQGCIPLDFEYLQRWRLYKLSGQLVLVFDTGLYYWQENVFSYVLMFKWNFVCFSLCSLTHALSGIKRASLVLFDTGNKYVKYKTPKNSSGVITLTHYVAYYVT